MKRLSVILSVIAIGIAAIAFSQTEAHNNTREEVKQYFDKNVFPELEKQQELYLKKLTDSEKTELSTLKEIISERRVNYTGKHPNSYYRSGANTIERPVRSEMQSDIKNITNAHPKQNDSYKIFVENNKQKWIADITAIHDKNNIVPMRNNNNRTGIQLFFERASRTSSPTSQSPDRVIPICVI